MTPGFHSPEFTRSHKMSVLNSWREDENNMSVCVQGAMPATRKGAGEVPAVALETERRQKECVIGRGEDVR